MTIARLDPPLSTDQLIGFILKPLFRIQRFNRDVTIGLVGDKGAGKSMGGGIISTFDYALQGDPMFSNTRVKAVFDIGEERAERFGIDQFATFESKPLDKRKFLHFSPEYRGGVFFTHEFNIWLADARRSSSNLNLETDDVAQQLRKLKSAWIYDCIDEAFVDFRVRDATDIFIRTKDTAFSKTGMARQQPQGIEFEWWLYAMTDKGAAILDTEVFNSKTYQHAVGPIYVKGQQFWGLIDTEKKEKRTKYKTDAHGSLDDMGEYVIEDGPELVKADSEWGWLQEKIAKLKTQYDHIDGPDLWEYLQLKERGMDARHIGRVLSQDFNVYGNKGVYYFDKFSLEDGMKTKRKAAIPRK